MIWGVAILTMVVGSVVALTQTDVKRMLAYSSIAHAGFVLTGLIAADATNADGELVGVSSVLFYLVAYGFIDDRRLRGRHPRPRRRRRGDAPVAVGRSGQAVAAGGRGLRALPAGLRRHPADQRVHRQVRRVRGRGLAGGAWPLVVVGVVMSAVAAFFYVRVIVLMFFSPPAPDGPTVVVPSPLTTAGRSHSARP